MSGGGERTLVPFRGLRFFDEAHAHLFFGRDEQVDELLEKLAVSRFVTVIGSSGSGKSSLVRAGLIPALRTGFLKEAGGLWTVIPMRPGAVPVNSLAAALETSLNASDLEVTLRRGPLGLVEAVRQARPRWERNLLVLVDQFEELFRYRQTSKDESSEFVKQLLEAAGQRELPIHVVLTMRSDFLGQCAQFRDLPERINDGLYLVPRMRRDQMKQAITGPVRVAGAMIKPRLVQRMLNDVGDDPDQLPVLQHSLLRTWDQWKVHGNGGRSIDVPNYEEIGGFEGSLSQHANEVYEGLSAAQQRVARVLFQQLIERDAENREVRRPACVEDVAQVSAVSGEQVSAIIEAFVADDVALLTRNDQGLVDITHESLIRKWDRIQGTEADKGWLQEEVETRDEYLELARRAHRKRNEQDLLAGGDLERALRWRDLGRNRAWSLRYGPIDSYDTTLDFIRDSEATRMKERSRIRKARQWRLGVVAAVVASLGIFAWISSVRAVRNRDVARNLELVAQAEGLGSSFAPDSRQNGALLAAEALRRWDAAAPDRALRTILPTLPTLTIIHMGPVFGVAYSPDEQQVLTGSGDNIARVWEVRTGRELRRFQHGGPIYAVAYSPDGQEVLTGSEDMTARVWEVATGKQLRRFQHEGAVLAVAYSPDGQDVLTGSRDKTARVWKVSTEKERRRFLHENWVSAVAYSPGGQQILTGSWDKTVRVWEVATRKELQRFQHNGTVYAVAYSPDGQRVLTGSWDKTARVWEVATGNELRRFLHEDFVAAVAYSPDGQRVLTGSWDNTAREWELSTGRELRRFQNKPIIFAVAYSPDGQRVLTGGGDKTARVWEVSSEPRRLQHEARVAAVAYSPDGRQVLTGSWDNMARMWEVSTGKNLGSLQHDAAVTAVAYSPDGHQILTASMDNVARVWEVSTRMELRRLQHEGPIFAVAYSPDGQQVLTGSRDKTAREWELSTGTELRRFQHEGAVVAAAYSPDGQQVLTGSEDETARVWEVATGKELRRFQHEGPIFAVAYSPDGQQVLTGNEDKTARVWEVATGKELRRFQHEGPIFAVAYSPDAQEVLTGCEDKTARVWEVATGKELRRFQHEAAVVGVAYSPYGRQVLTGSRDQTARLYSVDASKLLDVACRLVGRNLTRTEWARYVGDVPYRLTCPAYPTPD